jgi:NhaP-type Na+/H+ or K+/H+ antiporter
MLCSQAYGGLRGAVSFSLATVLEEKYVPKKNILETTTIAVVFFTVFVQVGITTKWFNPSLAQAALVLVV